MTPELPFDPTFVRIRKAVWRFQWDNADAVTAARYNKDTLVAYLAHQETDDLAARIALGDISATDFNGGHLEFVFDAAATAKCQAGTPVYLQVWCEVDGDLQCILSREITVQASLR